jgi:hypothetical protein
MPNVFKDLDLRSLGRIKVRTPSTKPGSPHSTDQFDVSVTLVSGINELAAVRVRAIASDDFDDLPDAPQGIIGRDILSRCNFTYLGLDKLWNLYL